MKNRVPEVFLSEMFGELRIMEDDNKFYFCAADVCSALGYSNPSHELNIHCRHDGIKAGRTDVNGVPRIIKFISEGNVYRLICRSNKPEAEKFETWVFDELLPRIRQTGGYVNDPVVFVDNWLPNTDAKTKALLVTSLEAVKNQDNIIGVQQESVEFHRAVSASVNSVDFGEFAKCLANDRINIGRNRLMAWLRKEKYYVNIVSSQEVQIQHARFTMDGEEFRQYVMELDRHRRALHEGLMARVNFANRLCVKLNTPVLAERVTEENRETYFAFAKEVVDSYFGEAMQNGRLL